MTRLIKRTYTVTADCPKDGPPHLKAMLSEAGAEAEVKRLLAEGWRNIKVTPVRDPAGSAG